MREEKKQFDKFVSAAREAGCDENERAFEDKLRKIAKANPTRDQENADAGKPPSDADKP